MAKPMPAISKKDISSLRSTLEYLKEAGELLTSNAEIDPHLELAAVQKRLDGGPPMLFEKVKGYPNARLANNIYASAERIARLFGVEDPYHGLRLKELSLRPRLPELPEERAA